MNILKQGRLVCLLICSCLPLAHSAAQNIFYDWGINAGSPSLWQEPGTIIQMDADRNVYVTGLLDGTFDFDPGPDSAYLTANSPQEDLFFAKYGSQGNYIWAKHIGAQYAGITPFALKFDNAGHIYITGLFYNSADFDPGPGSAFLNVTNLNSNQYVFFAKYDTSGNYIWAKGIVGNGLALSYTIETDNYNNIYLGGNFHGTFDFDPGNGIYNLMTLNTSGTNNIFIAQYDTAGNFKRVLDYGIGGHNWMFSIKPDLAGHIYVTGNCTPGIDLDPGPGIVLSDSGGVLIARYDTAFNYSWSRNIPSGYGFTFTLDNAAGIYVTGLYTGSHDFNPDSSFSEVLTAAGGYDIFITKFDTSGNFIWAKGIGGPANDRGYSIAVDTSHTIYLTGHFYQAADFDPGPGTANLTSNGNYDLFLAKYDSLGNYLWAYSFGAAIDDRGVTCC